MQKLALSLCLAMPLCVHAQTTITPSGAGDTTVQGASRTAIIRQFGGEESDVRSQRDTYEAKQRDRELDRQRRYREQDEQIQQAKDRQTSRFYCSSPAHQSDPECR